MNKWDQFFAVYFLSMKFLHTFDAKHFIIFPTQRHYREEMFILPKVIPHSHLTLSNIQCISKKKIIRKPKSAHLKG